MDVTAPLIELLQGPDADLRIQAALALGDDMTAPIVVASGSTSSTSPATTGLYGAVTPSPSQPGPRACRTASSTASGSSSRST